jgi:hypothetical protein
VGADARIENELLDPNAIEGDVRAGAGRTKPYSTQVVLI